MRSAPFARVLCDWVAESAKVTKWIIILAYPFALIFALLKNYGTSAAGLRPHTTYCYISGGILTVLHYYFGRKVVNDV